MSIESILRSRVKVINDEEWTLLGTPNDIIKELNADAANKVKQAELKGRIKEIQSIRVYENGLTAEKTIVFGDHFGVPSAEQRIADLTKQLEEIEKSVKQVDRWIIGPLMKYMRTPVAIVMTVAGKSNTTVTIPTLHNAPYAPSSCR